MTGITASVNEKELMVMHQDFAKHVAHLPKDVDDDDMNFFDSAPLPGNQAMEIQEPSGTKGRLEMDKVDDPQSHKIPCKERGSSSTSMSDGLLSIET